MTSCTLITALLPSLTLAPTVGPTEADVAQWLDVRPDRGDVEGCAYITGPASPIMGLYNDDLEISFWDGPSAMAFSLAKNDVWDRRYFGDRKQLVDIDAIRAMCFGGELRPSNGPPIPTSPQALYLAYDFPCPKPVGQVILRAPDLEGAADWRAGSTRWGGLLAEAANGGARGQLSAFLCRTENLLVVQGSYAGLTQPLSIELYRHQDTTPQGTSIAAIAHYAGQSGYDYTQDPDNGPLPHPEAGADGRFFWIRQRFLAEATFPDGFEYVLMGVIDGAEPELSAGDAAVGAGVSATIHPVAEDVLARMPGYLKEVRIATERVNDAPSGSRASAGLTGPDATFTLYLTAVTTRDAADPLAAAREALTEAVRRGAETLEFESFSAGDVGIRDWRNSRVMHYNATSCSYMDSTPWHGDYHFNEGYFTNDIVAGGADGLEQRLRLFEEMLPALKRNATEAFHCGGIAFPLVHYPIRAPRVVYSNYTWEWGIENTALMLQPFWQVFQYTQDLDFLRDRAYPMLVEGARFYADYVTRGDDGLYHVIPTVSQEHWGLTPEFRLNRDSVGALSFVKYQLKACIEASEILGVDAEERARWQEIVDHLAPYPTLDTPGGPVFCDVRDAPEILDYNITANLVMVLWAEDIGLDSAPDLLALARRSYDAIPNKEHSMRPGYLQQIRLFLGMADSVDLSPQGRVLSWPGRIHLYAGVPAGTAVDDTFSGYLAVGGFEVSAQHRGTEVRGVRITSRAGRTCRVRSPYGVEEVRVMDFDGRRTVPHTMDGDTIAFDTQRGHRYALLSGPELPLADRRFVEDDRLVGRWDFGRGSLSDTSGNGHDARLVGTASLGEALALDGNTAYAEVARTPDFDFAPNESFSVTAKVRFPAGLPPEMIPIVCSMADRQYCLMLSNGRAHFYLSSPRGDVFCSATGNGVLTDGEWHVVQGVRDVSDGIVRVYVDGRMEGSALDRTEGDFACAAPITIGAYLWGDRSRYAQGTIAEAEIRSLGRLE